MPQEREALSPNPSDASSLGFWYDGHLHKGDRITLNIQDPGLLYGATVFTTLRVFAHNLDHPRTHWKAHLTRLRQLPPFWVEPDWTRLRQGCELLSAQCPILRITLFPDGREWITGRSLPPDLLTRQIEGIRAQVLDPSWSRSLPRWKTGNYLAPWLGLRSAQTAGLQEGIFVDAAGNWLETTTGNLWGLRSGVWVTPPLESGVLGGVMREWILADSPDRSGEFWTPDLVQTLDAIAYSNCVVGIVPIQEVVGMSRWESASCDAFKALQIRVLG